MPFEFTCPYCFKRTLIEDALAGQSGPCVSCGKTVTIPGEVPAPPATGTQPAENVTTTAQRGVSNSPHFGLLLKGLGFVVVVGVLLSFTVFLFWPLFRGLKARRDKITSQSNLQQVVQALNAYAADYGTYPPPTVFDKAGKPMHSWRVLLLPYLGEQALYATYNFDEPWDSNDNSTLLPRCPSVYRSPGSSENTCFLITGQGTLFPASGPLGPAAIPDGLGTTLLVVESDNPLNEWTKPLDIEIAKLNPTIGASGPNTIGGNHSGGAAAAFADGSPAWLADDLNPVLLQAVVSPDGGEPVAAKDFQLP